MARPPAAPPPARRGWIPALAVAVVAYVPLLLTEPGVVVADTKTYLYLDPSRLLSRAWSMWDPSIGTGTVPHQNIGYLWPMGPWYWVFDRLGVPDWVAQRLWLGTIIAAAAYGVVWLLRTLGWRGPEPWAAAALYGLTPYVLTVAARISVLLLPFAALPWMVGLVVRAVRQGGWRWPAWFALVVTTAGSVNLTALVLAGMGPVLWLVYAVAVGEITLRRALGTVVRIGVLTVPVCAWWLAGLWVQGGFGIDVLRYTETAAVVAQTSTANEVLRGLGYWFFYGGDKLGPWIEPSVQYTQRIGLIGLSYLIPIAGLVGFAVARWRHRAYFVLLVAVGTLLAVGAHPWDDPSIFGHGVEAFLQSDRGLAMRSLPRAIPLVALGLAVGLAAGAAALGRRLPRVRWMAVAALMAVAVANLPTLWLRQMVPANLQRPEDVPAYWTQAAAAIDAGDHSTRVLEIPGADFASYRWGNTVDPVTPGLIDRPYVARELIPYGTPASADLLVALDHRLQERIADPGQLAVIARLLSAGDVVVRSDLQYERFNTPRPRNLWHDVTTEPGLGTPQGYGPPTPNVAVPDAALDDELELQTPASWADPPPVAMVPVDSALPIVRAADAGAPVVVAGDGEGLVDAAGAGLIDGSEVLLYSASDAGKPDELRKAVGADAALLVTDSNRRRGRRWTTVRHNTGYTEEAGTKPLVTDLTDNRLDVFPGAGDDTMTVAEHRGGVHAQATAYGNPFTFTPEERAANAADGDPATAWRTAAFGDARGQRLELRYDQPQTTDSVELLQPQNGDINRTITKVRLRFDDRDPLDVDLDQTSNVKPGQQVTFPSRTFSKLSIEILADTGGTPPRYGGLTSEGFAEVTLGDAGPRLDEVIRVPTDLLGTLGPSASGHPLTLLLTRQRSAPTDPTRGDEERTIVRAFAIPAARGFTVAGLVRLSSHASDDLVDRVLGVGAADGSVVATSSGRLPGDLAARASATLDGDPSTAWVGLFGPQEGQWLDYRSPAAVTADHLALTLVADGQHSVPTALDLTVDGRPAGRVTVPEVADQPGRGATAAVSVPLPAALTGSDWRLTVAAVREVRTISWNSAKPVTMPVGVAEMGLGGLALPPASGPWSSGCRSDLMTVDGSPVALEVGGTVEDAVAGRPLTARPCGGALQAAAGDHVARSAFGGVTGLDLDQLSLRSAADSGPSAALGTLATEARDESGHPGLAVTPVVRVTSDEPDAIDAFVVGARPGQPFWLVLGQSASPGWHASVDGADLGPSQLVDGYANGWLVTPSSQAMRVRLRFTPQRVVDGALVLSGAAALVCLWLGLSRRGRPKPWEIPAAVRLSLATAEAEAAADAAGRGAEPAPLSLAGLAGSALPRLPWAAAALLTVGAAVGSLVVAGPAVAAATGVVALVACLWPRARAATALVPAAALAAAAAYVVAQQLRHHIAPGLEWPTELEAAHPLGWLAVTALVADAAVRALASRAVDRAVNTASADPDGPGGG